MIRERKRSYSPPCRPRWTRPTPRSSSTLKPARWPRTQDLVPGARRVADAEGAQHLLAEPALGQVLARLAPPPRSPRGSWRRRPAVRSSSSLEPAALLAPRLGPRVLLLALELDPVAVGEQLDRLGEAEPLLLLDELDHVAADPAAEAVVELLLRRRPRTTACAPRGTGRGRPSGRPGGAGRCGRRSTSTMSAVCLTRSRLSGEISAIRTAPPRGSSAR